MAKRTTKSKKNSKTTTRKTPKKSGTAKASKTRTAKIKTLTPRLPDIPESKMTAKQRAVMAEIQTSRGRGTLGGPFGVMLHAPDSGPRRYVVEEPMPEERKPVLLFAGRFPPQ